MGSTKQFVVKFIRVTMGTVMWNGAKNQGARGDGWWLFPTLHSAALNVSILADDIYTLPTYVRKRS